MKYPKKYAGVTLIELMVVVAVLAILLTLGIPSFQETIRNNRIATQANSLLSALNIARSEAIKRGGRVTLCKSDNLSNCVPGADWQDGWIIFADSNTIGTIDEGDQIIQTWEAIEGKNTLSTGESFSNFVSYFPTGRASGNDTFSLCDSRKEDYGRSIVISLTGRPRIEKGAALCR